MPATSDVAGHHVQGRPPHGHACSEGPVPRNQNQSKFKFQDAPITKISSTPCAISLVFRRQHERPMCSCQEERKPKAIGRTLVENDPHPRHLAASAIFGRLLRLAAGAVANVDSINFVSRLSAALPCTAWLAATGWRIRHVRADNQCRFVCCIR